MTLSNLDSLNRIGFTVRNPYHAGNPIMDCNDCFLELTGYQRHEVVGRNWQFLIGPGTDLEKVRQLQEGIDSLRPVMVELLCYRKDGSSFMNAIMTAPVYDDRGNVSGILGSHVETSVPGHRAANGNATSLLGERRRKAKEAVSKLTPRQVEVLRGIAEGKLTKQVAFELGLSERTVKMHRAAMLKSIGAATNAEAIRLAVEAGM